MGVFPSIVTLLASSALSQSPLDVAVGLWELDPISVRDRGDFTCDQHPIKIEIDKPAMRYTSSRDGEQFPARILEVTADAFLIEYDNEERLDDDGRPVQWYLRLGDADHFVWVRKDWVPFGGMTPMRRRCKTPLSS